MDYPLIFILLSSQKFAYVLTCLPVKTAFIGCNKYPILNKLGTYYAYDFDNLIVHDIFGL